MQVETITLPVFLAFLATLNALPNKFGTTCWWQNGTQYVFIPDSPPLQRLFLEDAEEVTAITLSCDELCWWLTRLKFQSLKKDNGVLWSLTKE